MARMSADDWATEIRQERRELEQSERADLDHRITDRLAWHRELRSRRERILLKEILEVEARAREEAEAELAECWRGDAA
jgi:hypothetical protein